jgi:phenylpyruvate tautomerase PptA (4-oxalocrotonate tautomerase family)
MRVIERDGTVCTMPLVTVTLRKGRPPEFLRRVGDAVHSALVAQAKIPEADRFHVFHEVDANHIDVDPTFAGSEPVERSKDVLIIQIVLNAGRSDEVKSALYAEIASNLQSAGVRPDDVFVNLVEVMKQNWSMASGRMTYPA